MSAFVPFSIGLVTSLVLLSLFLLARSHGSSTQQRLYGALLCSIECYFLVPVTHDMPLARAVVSVEATIPALFWLFSASLFNDSFRLRYWHLFLVLTAGGLPWLGQGLREAGFQGFGPALRGSNKVLLLAFVVMALWPVIRHWRGDLISSRRQLRVWFCLINGTYMFTFLFWRDILQYPLIWPGAGEYVLSALVWVVTMGLLVQFVPGLLAGQSSLVGGGGENRFARLAVSSAQAGSAGGAGASNEARVVHHDVELPPGLMAAIDLELEEKHGYRDVNLSIGQLAYHLELPEHVLRKIINRELGFRNFKDFLNGFRIRDACRRLVDPEDAEVSILTIALDAGFRSLSTFNRVFKDVHSMTPSAYRREHLEN